MCGPTDTLKAETVASSFGKTGGTVMKSNATETTVKDDRPVDVVLEPPSTMARYVCASIMIGIFGVWGKICFADYVVDEKSAPGIGSPIHDWKIPALLTTSYLVSLPLLRYFSTHYLSQMFDVKLLLKETMIVYNGGQVLLNGWMVYRFVDALINHGHPFIGDLYTVQSGTTFAIWIHYMDKYLEFFDTVFMVLRGRMDQVCFVCVNCDCWLSLPFCFRTII